MHAAPRAYRSSLQGAGRRPRCPWQEEIARRRRLRRPCSLPAKGGGMPEVTIVGGGIAGLTSALRLLERGFEVTLIEQDPFLGGMLRAAACDDATCHVRHE